MAFGALGVGCWACWQGEVMPQAAVITFFFPGAVVLVVAPSAVVVFAAIVAIVVVATYASSI